MTNSRYTEKYFFGTRIESEWKEGSIITYSRNGEVTDHGIILKYEPFNTLSFTWINTNDNTPRVNPTRVTFTLKPMDTIVKLTLRHENLAETDYVEDDDTFQGFNNGWPAILSNLKSLLETGKTLGPLSL